MKLFLSILYYLVLLVLFLSFVVSADGITEKGLERLLRSKILMAHGIAANDVIVNAVLSQNVKQMPMPQVRDLDRKWRTDKSLSPLKLERHMVGNRSPARTKIFVNKANSFGFSHSKAKGFNAVYGHFRLVLGNV
ncbi:MAG: hypothetical protein ACI9FJ_002359 [Alteromonadaceae bacterium]|jgi:hypothetical protein